MEAEINIGELNICVNCGQLQITYSLDEDGLPLCESCTTYIDDTHDAASAAYRPM